MESREYFERDANTRLEEIGFYTDVIGRVENC